MIRASNPCARQRRLQFVAIAAAIALSRSAFALSVDETFDLRIELIPSDVIALDPCPPRCLARAYSALNPSAIYRPIEPDEIIFEGEIALIWGDAAGSEWLIWGRSDAPDITVWDDSMWFEEVDIETRTLAGVVTSRYSVSEDAKIRNPAAVVARGAQARARSGRPAAQAEPNKLGDLDEVPAELLTPLEQSWLAKLLERLSKSQYAVGAVTLGLLALMARLVR